MGLLNLVVGSISSWAWPLNDVPNCPAQLFRLPWCCGQWTSDDLGGVILIPYSKEGFALVWDVACEELTKKYPPPAETSQPGRPMGGVVGTMGTASPPEAAALAADEDPAEFTTLQRLRPGRCALPGCVGMSFRHLFCETCGRYLCRSHFVRKCAEHTEIDSEEVMAKHQLEVANRERALAGEDIARGMPQVRLREPEWRLEALNAIATRTIYSGTDAREEERNIGPLARRGMPEIQTRFQDAEVVCQAIAGPDAIPAPNQRRLRVMTVIYDQGIRGVRPEPEPLPPSLW